LPEYRRFSKSNNRKITAEFGRGADFGLDSDAARLFHPAVPGKVSFFKYWLPVILWMGLIFEGSTDALSSRHTSGFIGPFLRWFFPGISSEAIRSVQMGIRKGGHVSEYFVLALLLWRARRRPLRNDPRPWSWREAAFAILVAAGYAATDEYHQWFVPSRGASVWDVLLDALGATAGVLALWWIGRRRKRW